MCLGEGPEAAAGARYCNIWNTAKPRSVVAWICLCGSRLWSRHFGSSVHQFLLVVYFHLNSCAWRPAQCCFSVSSWTTWENALQNTNNDHVWHYLLLLRNGLCNSLYSPKYNVSKFTDQHVRWLFVYLILNTEPVTMLVRVLYHSWRLMWKNGSLAVELPLLE